MTLPTPSATDEHTRRPGELLALALAAKDAAGLRALFTTPVRFRAVTPRRFWDAETPPQVVDDIILGTWFDSSKEITGLDLLESDLVGDVHRTTYRLTVSLASGPAVVEQTAYYTTDDGLITDIRLVCSGFRPVSPGSG